MSFQHSLSSSSRLLQRSLAARLASRTATRRFASTEAGQSGLSGSADNAFNRERLAVKQHAKETSSFWRKLSIYVVIPALIITSANTWVQWNEHWEHQKHMPPIEDRTQYSYQNIRNKSYPWGDGTKTLFWNNKVNYYKKPEGGD